MPVYNVEVDGQIYQVESDQELTEQEIQKYVGSTIEYNAPVKEPTPEEAPSDWFNEFVYGFKEQNSDVQNLAIIAESYFPVSQAFSGATPEEQAAYEALTPDQRRQFINAQRNAKLKAEYPDLYAAGEKSGWTMVGNVAGALASPTTLLPVGATYKGMAAIGGLLGLEFDVLDQLAEKGEVDPKQALTTAAVGSVAAPVVGAAVRGASSLLSKKTNAKAVQKANEQMQELELAINQAAQDGNLSPEAVAEYATKAMSTEEARNAMAISGYKPQLLPPEAREAVLEVLENNGVDSISRASNSFLDQFLGSVSTRIGMISEPLKLRLRKLDSASHENTHALIETVRPFNEMMKKLPETIRKSVDRSLFNGDFASAVSKLKRYDKDAASKLNTVRGVFNKQFQELRKAGYKVGEVPNYFHREIVDKEGLFKALGRKRVNEIQRNLEQRKKQLGVSTLTKQEEDTVINNTLRGYTSKINNSGLSATKERRIDEITDELLPYYANSTKSLDSYIRSTVNNIEKRKFFGQYAKDLGETSIDTEASIGTLLANEGRDLDPFDLDVLKNLLNARFVNGEKGASNAIQVFRNVGYGTTLANPISAVTQLADLSGSIYKNGAVNTLKAILSPNKDIDMVKMGLYDAMAEEFANEAMMARSLHRLFEWSGFAAIDKLGKNVFLRSSFNKAIRMAQSSKGVEKLRKKYGKAYGDEFNNLVADLKAGNITDNTKLYLWSELADMQPIALSEMTQKYLESPNGRVWYMMKTWMLKQVDVLRRDIKHQWSAGNKKEAMRNAIAYMSLIPVANMTTDQIKNVLLGREPMEPDDLPEEFFTNILKVFGGSEYLLSKYGAQGDIGKMGLEMLAPPVSWINGAASAVGNAVSGDSEEALNDLLSNAPIIGRFWYNWMAGGLEKFEARQD